MTRTLAKTSVQLSAETLQWLDQWPRVSRSEAIRLALDRSQYLIEQMGDVTDLALQYHPVLAPALEDFDCADYRTIARALPGIVGGYIQENADRQWLDDGGNAIDTAALHRRLQALQPAQRIHLLDCIVARRDWPSSLAAKGQNPHTLREGDA